MRTLAYAPPVMSDTSFGSLAVCPLQCKSYHGGAVSLLIDRFPPHIWLQMTRWRGGNEWIMVNPYCAAGDRADGRGGIDATRSVRFRFSDKIQPSYTFEILPNNIGCHWNYLVQILFKHIMFAKKCYRWSKKRFLWNDSELYCTLQPLCINYNKSALHMIFIT